MLKQLWTYLKVFDSKPPAISLLIIKTYIVTDTRVLTTYGQVQRSFAYTTLLLWLLRCFTGALTIYGLKSKICGRMSSPAHSCFGFASIISSSNRQKEKFFPLVKHIQTQQSNKQFTSTLYNNGTCLQQHHLPPHHQGTDRCLMGMKKAVKPTEPMVSHNTRRAQGVQARLLALLTRLDTAIGRSSHRK